MISSTPQIRKHFQAFKPYPMSDLNLNKNIINLSSNENAIGPSLKVRAALQSALQKSNRYANTTCKKLVEKLAQLYNIHSDNIICGNGSAELIFLLAELFSSAGDEVLILKHGFLFYETAITRTGATVVHANSKDFINIDDLIKSITEKTKIIFIDNPNNPTGAYLNQDELLHLCQNVRKDILLVIDAAYAEYVTAADYSPGMELVSKFDNVCVLRTFSKIYGLAGFRLGWMYGPKLIVEAIRKVQQPASISTAAQYAAIAALDESARIIKICKQNRLLQEYLLKELACFNLKLYPSEGNFVLVDFYSEELANKIFSDLLNNDILTRPMHLNRLPSCLRITIGQENEMTKLTQTLALSFK